MVPKFVHVPPHQKPCNSTESKGTTAWHFNLPAREKAQIWNYMTFWKGPCTKKQDTHYTHLSLLCQFKTQVISARNLVSTVTDTPKPYIALVTVWKATDGGVWRSVYNNEGEKWRCNVQTEMLLVKGSDNCRGSNSLILAETAECCAFLWFIFSAEATEHDGMCK